MFTQAYSPEQSAHGQLPDGREILILYVKEWAAQLAEVNANQIGKFQYNWFTNEDQSEFILHIEWSDSLKISVRFTQQHQQLLDYLRTPKDVIITAIPIAELVEKSTQVDFLALDGPIASFKQLIFTAPHTLKQ